MDEIIELLEKGSIKYIYNKEDEVITIGNIEVGLTTNGNVSIFDKKEDKYISTLSKEHAIKALNI